MRAYTDLEVLLKAEETNNFKGFPSGYWLFGIQSKEDKYNEFDDKFFVFKGDQFVMSLRGTTNAGSSALMNYKKFNPLGTAMIKTDEWYIDIWKPGLHRGRMECLKQVRPIKHYRDNNRNKKSEQYGKMYNSLIGCEFHTATYSMNMNFIRRFIGGWSAACQVINSTREYYKALRLFQTQEFTSYCLVKEF